MTNKIRIRETIREEETPFDRAKLISWWDQNVIENARVLVLGAGATSNELLKNLALLGVGDICVCDMDLISTSNLSRTVLFGKDDVGKFKAPLAAERVRAMSNNPNCRTDAFVGDITHDLGGGVFRRFDLVFGCLDNSTTRLYTASQCAKFGKPLIDCGIDQLDYCVSAHHYPASSCFACGMDLSLVDREHMVRHSCDSFKRRAIEEKHGATVILSAASAAALQAQEGIKLLHELKGIPLEVKVKLGRRYTFYGSSNMFVRSEIPIKDDCPAHYETVNVIETPLSAHQTLGEILDELEKLLGCEVAIDTYPDSTFITKTICPVCGKELTINKPKHVLFTDDLYCDAETCREQVSAGHQKQYTALNLFDKECGLLDFSLTAFGIPPLHVLTVRPKDGSDVCFYVELTGDLDEVLPNTGKG